MSAKELAHGILVGVIIAIPFIIEIFKELLK